MTRASVVACALLILASAASAAAPFAEGRLWRIARAGVPDSYVLGTIHIADARVSRIVPPIADALGRSRTLAVEVAPWALSGDASVDLEQLERGQRLEALVGSGVYAQVRSALLDQGMTEPAIARLKPWAAMLRVAQIAHTYEAPSLDENLLVAARERGIRVLPLELIDEQIAAFDTVPLESQVALLAHAIAHRHALATTVEPTIRAWLRGDLAAITRMSQTAGDGFPGMQRHYAALARHVVHDRTVLLHHRLNSPLRAGRVFVAVGASHLYGNAGLLALLRNDGYRVTRLW
jgi:uncharacterized protein YbaP (TraB family)